MSKAIEVIDKAGNRVVRHNGILQDGDRVRALRMIDSMMPPDPRLQQAITAAEAAKRLEAFDAKNHRPGYGVTDANAVTQSEKTRDAYQDRLRNAWKAPAQPPINPQDWTRQQPSPPATQKDGTRSHDELIAARDRRLEEAYKG